MWSELLAHAIPVRHGQDADPYITIGLLTLGVAAAIGTGIVAGNLAVVRPRLRSSAQAFAAGALVLLLFDLLKETASLGQGLLTNPLLQAGLLAAYAAGVLLLAQSARGGENPRGTLWAWTIGIAAHGAGESWIVGSEALTADITAPTQAASFIVHKVIEGATIPLLVGGPTRRLDIIRVTALMASTALLSGALSYGLGANTMPLLLFALGAGAATFALLRMANQFPLTLRHAGWLVVGLIVIWSAGWLHELQL